MPTAGSELSIVLGGETNLAPAAVAIIFRNSVYI